MQTKPNFTASVFKLAAGFLFLIPVRLFSQEVTGEDMSMQAMAPEAGPNEVYDGNGVYRLESNGKVRVQGHHINRVKTGEFIYFNQYGQLERMENYQDGLLHGRSAAYTYSVPTSQHEYYKGKKINYEYEFSANDTTFMAGPYLKDEAKSGVFIMRSKKRIVVSYNKTYTQINYDTVFFEAPKPVKVHHYRYTKKADKLSRDVFTVMDLKTKKAAYTPQFIESLVSELKTYEPYYFPTKKNCLTKCYNEAGGLIFKSDSGYTVTYAPNGQKDSICICEEGKVCRTGYNAKGQLIYAVRMDKLSPQHTTNLYYDKKKTVIYEVTALNDVPEAVKIHSDSVRKQNAAGVLADYFGTRYFYNPATLAIDSSMTSLEYKYRKREAVPNGRYFMIAPKGKKKKMYRAIEFNGDRYDDYGVDSTLGKPGNKGGRVKMYGNDSIIYLVSDNDYYKYNPKDDKYIVRKFQFKNGKVYAVHSRVNKTGIYSKELLLDSFEADTLPNLKTELIPEKDFNKVMDMKPIYKMSKKECLLWVDRCKAIKDLNDKNQAAFASNSDYSYTVDAVRRLYIYEFYRMGYNIYETEDVYMSWAKSLNLSATEKNRVMYFLK